MIHYVKGHPIREFYSIKTKTRKVLNKFIYRQLQWSSISDRRNRTLNAPAPVSRLLDRAISECECVVSLNNHFSNECRCNIFRRVICPVHHTLCCIQLYSENRHATREHSDAFWLMEASKELKCNVPQL